MGFVHCSICKKLFNKGKSNLCPECAEIESKNIKKVTDYLQVYGGTEGRNISVESLSEATGIEIKEIERLYRTAKLRGCICLVNLNCKLCGQSFRPTIFTGFFCKNCSTKVEKIASELKSNGSEKQVQEEKSEPVINNKTSLTKRMHIRDNH